MPGFDRSGPQGNGLMSGWQGGLCRRTESEEVVGVGRGLGRGRGRGMGRGLGLRRGLDVPQKRAEREEGVAGTPIADEKAAGDESLTAAGDAVAELVSLKKHYREAADLLEAMAERIAVLEAKK